MKTMINIKSVIIIVTLFVSTALIAQKQEKQEFLVYTGGGISTLKIKTEFGSPEMKTGVLLGVGYSRFLSENIAITTGVEFASHNLAIQLNTLEGNYITNDGMEDFDFQYRIYNYNESHNVLFVNCPLMLHYQTGGVNRFYVAAGGKIGIPVSYNNQISGSHIRTQGFYPQYGSEAVLESPAYHAGFGTFRPSEISDDIKFNIACIASIEAGMKWSFSPKFSLYTGLYLDYGLNDISLDKDKEFLPYNKEEPSNYIYNSALTSYSSQQGSNKLNLVDNVFPMAIGVKVKLAFRK